MHGLSFLNTFNMVSLYSAKLQLLLSHVELGRSDGISFFICLATTHLTWLIPEGIAVPPAARLPAGMCACGFPDGCEEECSFTGQSGVGH